MYKKINADDELMAFTNDLKQISLHCINVVC